MRSTKAKRWLSGTLAALMLAQGMCLPVGAEAWWNSNWNSWFGGSSSQTIQVETQETKAAAPQLKKSGTAIIPSDATPEQVKQALYEALVSNKEEVTAGELNWEYYCEGKDKSGLIKNSAWGSVNGFETQTGSWVKVTYTHPALAANADGSYQVRIAGTSEDKAVTLTKKAKLDSSIVLNEGTFTVALPYNEDTTVNYDALRESIFKTVVASTTPELTVDDVTIEYYYEGYTALDSKWLPLEGETVVGEAGWPAISAKNEPQKIKISWGGNDDYYGFKAQEVQVTITERPEANIQINENASVKLSVTEDMQLDIEKLYQDVFDAVIVSSTPELDLGDVKITYYALNYVIDPSVPGATHEWMPLEGGTKNLLTYPAIPAGSQQIRISWSGNQNYAPTTIEATVQVNEREQVKFNQKQGPYEVGMVFNDEQGYDYTATAKAIYDAVVESTTPTVDFENVKLEFSKTGTIFKPLDQTNFFTEFGVGVWKIRISVGDTQTYRGNSITVDVTTTDNRATSSVVLKSGASFTYNMDANAMKQAIFDNVIDWTNSALPDKNSLSIDNFTFEYSGEDVLPGGIDGGVKQWAPIEGGTVTLLTYPQMGAGENQQIRVSFKGNSEFRPSGNVDGTVTVNKAKVSVKVNSTNIYADEQLSASFITTDPADKFDIYTIYAGITSNVTTGVYLDLPDRYTNSTFLKIIDGALELAGKKTLTQMMQDGVTVGELREIFSTQELLDLLDKLNIDTGTFGQILTVINKTSCPASWIPCAWALAPPTVPACTL